jgi:arginase
MTVMSVPYHLDEDRGALDLPLPAAVTVTAPLPPGDPWSRMTALYRRVADGVAAAVAAGRRPTVQCGDCMASLGVMAGLQRAGLDPAVVWFDAHGDVQTLETSTSGYLGGIPLRLLVGYRPELIASALGLRPVAEDRVVLVDARDLDPPEVAYLARVPIRRATVATAADDLPPGPLYLHVDVDVARPEDLPGLLYPAPGGPPLAEVARAVGAVLATGRVAAVGLACTWRPGHGTGERLRAAWPEPPE